MIGKPSLPSLLERLQADHAGRGLLGSADDLGELVGPLAVQDADHVGAVVHRDLRVLVADRVDVPVVGVVVLALDRVDLGAVAVDQRGGDVVLGRERVRRAERDVRAAGGQRADEVGRLGRDVQAEAELDAVERLLALEALADRGEHRHVAVRPLDPRLAGVGQRQVGDVVVLCGCGHRAPLSMVKEKVRPARSARRSICSARIGLSGSVSGQRVLEPVDHGDRLAGPRRAAPRCRSRPGRRAGRATSGARAGCRRGSRRRSVSDACGSISSRVSSIRWRVRGCWSESSRKTATNLPALVGALPADDLVVVGLRQLGRERGQLRVLVDLALPAVRGGRRRPGAVDADAGVLSLLGDLPCEAVAARRGPHSLRQLRHVSGGGVDLGAHARRRAGRRRPPRERRPSCRRPPPAAEGRTAGRSRARRRRAPARRAVHPSWRRPVSRRARRRRRSRQASPRCRPSSSSRARPSREWPRTAARNRGRSPSGGSGGRRARPRRGRRRRRCRPSRRRAATRAPWIRRAERTCRGPRVSTRQSASWRWSGSASTSSSWFEGSTRAIWSAVRPGTAGQSTWRR